MDLFAEARNIISKGKIEFSGEGNNREFWSVASVSIEVRKDKDGRFLKCTCKHHSIYGNDSLCSYKTALIGYLVLKHIVKKKEVEV